VTDPWNRNPPSASSPGPPQGGYGVPPGGSQNPYGPPPPGYGSPPPGYGQAGPPPYGYGYGPTPPGYGRPPHPHRTRNILLIVLAVVLLVLGGCGAGAYALYRSQKANADTTNEFLRGLRDQNYSAAYDKLCSRVRAQVSADQFAEAARASRDNNRGVRSYRINNVSTHSTNGVTTRTAGGRVTLTDGTVRTETYYLDKESGTLCVLSGYDDLVGGS
jgi:hypothetical protein